MSERIYQVIIGVLVLVILVGGALMVASKRASVTANMGAESPAMVSTTSSEQSASYGTANTSGTSVAIADSGVTTVKPGSASVSPSTMAQGDAVTVADQPAGKSVNVGSATLSRLGWVAIRQNGWILGAELLHGGAHKNVTVTLLRATAAGKSYEVILYADDGDKSFNLHKDSLIVNSDGSAVSAAFLAK